MEIPDFHPDLISKGASTRERVIDQLRDLILSGTLSPGFKLPTEPELGDLFKVGRSTIREAVVVLVSQGLLEIQRGAGGGTLIAMPEGDQISRRLETEIAMLTVANEVSLNEILESRRILEVPAAGLAAQRATSKDISDLSLALENEEAAPGAVIGGRRQVHRTILRATHNELLRVMTVPLFAVTRTRYLRDKDETELWPTINAEHRRLFDAIKSGDVEGAKLAMSEHLDTLVELYWEIETKMHD